MSLVHLWRLSSSVGNRSPASPMVLPLPMLSLRVRWIRLLRRSLMSLSTPVLFLLYCTRPPRHTVPTPTQMGLALISCRLTGTQPPAQRILPPLLGGLPQSTARIRSPWLCRLLGPLGPLRATLLEPLPGLRFTAAPLQVGTYLCVSSIRCCRELRKLP